MEENQNPDLDSNQINTNDKSDNVTSNFQAPTTTPPEMNILNGVPPIIKKPKQNHEKIILILITLIILIVASAFAYFYFFKFNDTSVSLTKTESIQPTKKAISVTNGGYVLAGFGIMPVVSSGDYVWAVNPSANVGTYNVSQFDVKTGALVRTISGSNYGFTDNLGIASDGAYVWFANGNNGTADDWSITKVNATTGALVKILSASNYGFGGVGPITVDGSNLWVQDVNGLKEINTSTDTLVQTISNSKYAMGLISSGNYLWAISADYKSITKIDENSGNVVQTLPASNIAGLSNFEPNRIASDGTHLWVGSANTVAEIDAKTGTLIQILSDSRYNFSDITAIVSDGAYVWIASPVFANSLTSSNGGGSVAIATSTTLTQISADTGALVQTLNSENYGSGLALDGTYLWVYNGTKLSKLDSSTGKLIKTIE